MLLSSRNAPIPKVPSYEIKDWNVVLGSAIPVGSWAYQTMMKKMKKMGCHPPPSKRELLSDVWPGGDIFLLWKSNIQDAGLTKMLLRIMISMVFLVVEMNLGIFVDGFCCCKWCVGFHLMSPWHETSKRAAPKPPSASEKSDGPLQAEVRCEDDGSISEGEQKNKIICISVHIITHICIVYDILLLLLLFIIILYRHYIPTSFRNFKFFFAPNEAYKRDFYVQKLNFWSSG